MKIFRVTVRGWFDALTDEQRAALLTVAAEHDVVAVGGFTETGTLTYERALHTFTFRVQLRDDEEAVVLERATTMAVAEVEAMGVAHRDVRAPRRRHGIGLVVTRTVAVVGGGPAGLMAAEVLATAGMAVTVYERMPTMGRKLQVAGRGGLNLTHSEPLDAFLDRYGPARAHLAPAIEHFGPDALRAWSEGLGEATFVGSSGRVFPEGFRATTLLRAWLRRLDDLGVELRTRHTWEGWTDDGALAFTDRDGAAISVTADASVLALGGASWPRTGSDGAWVAPLQATGVDVRPLRPANSGFVVAWSEVFRNRFAGTPVKDAAARHGGMVARGDLMITSDGVEGGPIYALSARLRSTIDSGTPALLEVDLFPNTSAAALAARIGRRRPKDSLTTALTRAGLAPVAVGLLREATDNQPPTSPRALAALLRMLPLTLTAPQPIERAISTAGGVALDAIDEHAMLRARPGTFVAGEMLDWEAPTGGYLLQAAFSTGVAAADGVLAYLGTVRS